MPIDLGLSRVTKLLHHLGNPHINAYKSIHIAGTNGKGSTVAYLSSILTQAKVRNGRFTSPHMVYYNDSICINNEVYPLAKFKNISDYVQKENTSLRLGCTEFELLTVTAFKIFEIERVDLAIIEVGLGGRLDATNVLEPFDPKTDLKGGVIATGITKIGIDHEALLGDTLAEIAYEKACIMKKSVPCIVDRKNEQEALKVVKVVAKNTMSDLYMVDGMNKPETCPTNKMCYSDPKSLLKYSPLKGDYQLQNLSIALTILDVVKLQNHSSLSNENGESKITADAIKLGIEKIVWPGRLQSINIPKTGLHLLLDGAHNASAAIELAKYLENIRGDEGGIIFVITLTKGKSIDNLLKHIVHKNDTVIPTVFSVPEQMPWISSYSSEDVQKVAENYVQDVRNIGTSGQSIEKVLDYVNELKLSGDNRNVVVCGSLYLCADILRYVDTLSK